MTRIAWFPVRSIILATTISLTACGQDELPEPRPELDYTRRSSADFTSGWVQSREQVLSFTEISPAAGIDFRHENGAAGNKWMPETMGSGCALFDYNSDEHLDILLVNSTHWPSVEDADPPTAALYRNGGDGSFADVTAQVGLDFSVYGMGVTVADSDADGDADLYLTTVGENVLLRNDDGRFLNITDQAGVGGRSWTDDDGLSYSEWSTAAAWVDVDNDGWLDLFVGNYVRWSPATDIYTSLDGEDKSYATPQQYPGSTCRLYRNLGAGSFEEVTQEWGLDLPMAKSLGVAMADFEDDGHIDLVVTNDTQPNFLLRNNGDGTFAEIGMAAGIGYDETGRARAGMGVDIASLDNDGVGSIAIGNFSREAVSLYRRVNQTFLDVAGKRRLVQSTLPTLTFGLLFRDFDLDGFQDLVLANGHIEPGINSVQGEIHYAQPPQLFWNDGEGRLLDISARIGGVFSSRLVGRGLAAGDIDLDGDIDLLLTSNAGPPYLLRNDGPCGRSIALHLLGKGPNRDAIGAVVTLTSDGLVQQRMVRTGSSYLSHSAPILHFGLGERTNADGLKIRWPDGEREEVGPLKAGSIYWLAQGLGIARHREFSSGEGAVR